MKVRKTARLDQILLRLGAVTEEQITRALRRQEARGGLLGRNLVELGIIDEGQLLEALAEQFRLPVIRPTESDIPGELVERLPAEMIRTGRILPVKWNEDRKVLSLAAANPGDLDTLRRAQDAFGARAVRVALASEGIMAEVGLKLVGPGDDGAGDGHPDSRIALPELFAREEDDTGEAPDLGGDVEPRRVLLVTASASKRNFLPPLLEREGVELSVAADREQTRAALSGDQGPDAVLVTHDLRSEFADWLQSDGYPRPRCEVSVFETVSQSLLENPVPYAAVGASLLNAVQAVADARCAQVNASPPYGLMATEVEALADRRGLRRVARDGLQLGLHLLLPTRLQGPDILERSEPFASFASSLELAARIRFPWKLDILLAACHGLFSGRLDAGGGSTPDFSAEVRLAAQILALVWYRHNHFTPGEGTDEERMIALRTALRDTAGRLATRDLVEGYIRLIDDRGGIADETGDRKVLLVGDERIERALGPALSRVAREVLVTGDLADAQTLAERRPPAAIVLDHECFSGQVDKFTRVAKLGGAALLFVLTDSSDPSLVLNLLDVGVDDVFGPPHEFDLVAARINRAIRSRSRDRGSERPQAGQFSATFEVFSFLDLIQMLSQGLKSVRIDLVRGRGEEAVIWMERGRMVHARVGDDVEGEAAVYRVIAWEDQGEFTVREESRFPERTIQVSSESVLMEGCRLLDEMKRG